MEDREAYVEQCKARAREYLMRGEIENAITSILSDLSGHSETTPNSVLAMLGMRIIVDRDHRGAERFIEGFH